MLTLALMYSVTWGLVVCWSLSTSTGLDNCSLHFCNFVTSDVLRVFHSSFEELLTVRLLFISYHSIWSFQGTYAGNFRYLMEMEGFEPLTPCLQGRCSPNWATPPFWVLYYLIFPMGLSGPYLYECKASLSLMGLSGLEPPTSRLSGVRSNRLSYKPI